MARTAVPLQTVTRLQSSVVTYGATDNVNGNLIPNDGQTVFLVKNTTGGSLTATFRSVTDSAGRSGDIAAAVATAAEQIVGPLRADLFNQRIADLGNIYVDYSGAGLTIAALQLNP